MAPSIVHLPNGQTLTVTPVFGGIQFKANELNIHHNAFPPGWTIILNCEDDDDDHDHQRHDVKPPAHSDPDVPAPKRHHVHRFRRPSLRNDHLFISSISNPSNTDFRPPSSPTRQIAMMLWASLWWYFHQPTPTPHMTTPSSAATPEDGRPKGEWRVNINREGIFKGKHLLPKLERMALISSEDSSVGVDPDDGVTNTGEGWSRMFVSQRSFWQLDARIYLFTLPPAQSHSPYPSASPATSRPTSPNRNTTTTTNLSPTRGADEGPAAIFQAASAMSPHHSRASTPPGPFHSGSHLPTFYPPPPTQYTFTNAVRHPIRPKPPRQGETFYMRYVPSLEQYLSFRVASLSQQPIVHRGPTSAMPESTLGPAVRESLRRGGAGAYESVSDSAVPTIAGLHVSFADNAPTPASSSDPSANANANATITYMTDAELLHKWMNDPRVSHSWGESGPITHQEAFLKHNLTATYSFPAIGCWDGKPFGYFEIYWAREDRLGSHLTTTCSGTDLDYARGLHCLVGEQDFRGAHRVKVWLSALVHYCWLSDSRTNVVVMEPRVDNVKLRGYCEQVGFYREKEVAFPHKQSNLMVIRREAWEAPAL